MKSYFVTGTDTDAGKTFICQAILAHWQTRQTLAMKPVSAGCQALPENGQITLINEDALALQQAASIYRPMREVNPFAYADAIAPHIAAAQTKQAIDIEGLIDIYQRWRKLGADYCLIEGAGGWRLPLNLEGLSLAHLAQRLSLPVIMVVNMRLGCLNHALLTAEAIAQDGLKLVAWVANCPQDMQVQEENINTLKAWLDAPCLGIVPACDNVREASDYLDLTALS